MNMINNHKPLRLFNKSKKLTLEIIMIKMKAINNAPDNKSVVDQTWNCKKMETINKIRIKILFLGSTLCVKVLYGE